MFYLKLQFIKSYTKDPRKAEWGSVEHFKTPSYCQTAPAALAGDALMSILPASGPLHQEVKREQLPFLIQVLVKPSAHPSPWISRNNLYIFWQQLRESQIIPPFICSVCFTSPWELRSLEKTQLKQTKHTIISCYPMVLSWVDPVLLHISLDLTAANLTKPRRAVSRLC